MEEHSGLILHLGEVGAPCLEVLAHELDYLGLNVGPISS